MDFSALNRPALSVLADALGRIDYADRNEEQTREQLRDAVAAAIAGQPATAPAPRVTIEDIDDLVIIRDALDIIDPDTEEDHDRAKALLGTFAAAVEQRA